MEKKIPDTSMKKRKVEDQLNCKQCKKRKRTKRTHTTTNVYHITFCDDTTYVIKSCSMSSTFIPQPDDTTYVIKLCSMSSTSCNLDDID